MSQLKYRDREAATSLSPESPKYSLTVPLLRCTSACSSTKLEFDAWVGAESRWQGPCRCRWSRRSELWDTNISHNGQSHAGNPEGELTWERSRVLSRGGGKKLLALRQTKNELFWPLYHSGYPMTIQYFHPGQRHVFWERFTMLAWAILHKLILQWKHFSN